MNLDLKNREWKEFPVKSLFNIERGTRLIIRNRISGNIPFVTAGFQNQGVAELIQNKEQKSFSNSITIDMFGNVFYRNYNFKCDDNIHVLTNSNINENTGNFIVNCIKKTTKDIFSYGKQFRLKTLERLKVLLPINEKSKPDYKFMQQYMRHKKQEKQKEYQEFIQNRLNQLKKTPKTISLDQKEWIEFLLKDIFTDIQRGKRLKKADHKKGNQPYISSTGSNKGLDNYIGNKEKVRVFENCITLANSGSVGACFYQPYSFVASDHVTKLENNEFDKYTNLFISSLVSRLGEKYSFNREINDKRIKKEKILLPRNENNEPDYEFMENYMKNLEYKKLNEYLKSKSELTSSSSKSSITFKNN